MISVIFLTLCTEHTEFIVLSKISISVSSCIIISMQKNL